MNQVLPSISGQASTFPSILTPLPSHQAEIFRDKNLGFPDKLFASVVITLLLMALPGSKQQQRERRTLGKELDGSVAESLLVSG